MDNRGEYTFGFRYAGHFYSVPVLFSVPGSWIGEYCVMPQADLKMLSTLITSRSGIGTVP